MPMTTDEIISRCYEHGQPDYVLAGDRLKELEVQVAQWRSACKKEEAGRLGWRQQAEENGKLLSEALERLRLDPMDAAVLSLARVWRECPEEKRPSPEALADTIVASLR